MPLRYVTVVHDVEKGAVVTALDAKPKKVEGVDGPYAVTILPHLLHKFPTDCQYAIIDDEGVLDYYSEVPREGAVVVEKECDLPAQKYRFDKGNERFEWIPHMFPAKLPPGDEDPLIAVALYIRRRVAAGEEVPEYTRRWLATFERYPDDYEEPKHDGVYRR